MFVLQCTGWCLCCSVRVLRKVEPKVGDMITLQLMKRERSSTHAVPLAHWQDRDGCPYNIDGDCFHALPLTKPIQFSVATAGITVIAVLMMNAVDLSGIVMPQHSW